jgi:nicotinamidase-related amidase
MMTSRLFVALLSVAILADSLSAIAAEKPAAKTEPKAAAEIRVPNRPPVRGKFKVHLKTRAEEPKNSGRIKVSVNQAEWKASETAIIICDMWNDHYCQLAAQRVDRMAPRMNDVVTAARSHGALIVHAPSGCMDVYKNTPYRRRVLQAPQVKAPIKIEGWCYLDPQHEAAMPVDTSKQSCDDPIVGKGVRRYSKQHAAIKIIGYDGISDNGRDIYNLFVQEGIKNVVVMGVHTNMCVLGRSFGLRQMVRLGFNVALARDLTDAMYDPREYPFVSHTRGTELVVEHIERYWCPTIEGADLMKVIPGTNDPSPDVIKARAKKVAASKR